MHDRMNFRDYKPRKDIVPFQKMKEQKMREQMFLLERVRRSIELRR